MVEKRLLGCRIGLELGQRLGLESQLGKIGLGLEQLELGSQLGRIGLEQRWLVQLEQQFLGCKIGLELEQLGLGSRLGKIDQLIENQMKLARCIVDLLVLGRLLLLLLLRIQHLVLVGCWWLELLGLVVVGVGQLVLGQLELERIGNHQRLDRHLQLGQRCSLLVLLGHNLQRLGRH